MEKENILGDLSNKEIPCKIHKINSILSNLINHWFGKEKMGYVSIYENAYCHFKEWILEIIIGYFKN